MSSSAALFLGAAGLGMSAFGTHKQVSAENQANKYNAQLARNNAIIAEQNAVLDEQRAGQARERGRIAQERLREQREQLKGSQRAGFAASGVRVDEGSALKVNEETAAATELDALMIEYNAETQAFDFEVDARNKRLQGREMGQRANLLESRSKRSSVLPVASQLLTGGTELYRRFA